MATDRGAHLETSPWGLPDRLFLKPKRLWVMVMMMMRISTWAPGDSSTWAPGDFDHFPEADLPP